MWGFSRTEGADSRAAGEVQGGEQAGRPEWVSHNKWPVTCSGRKVSFSSLQACVCVCVCVQEAAWNTHYKLLLAKCAAQSHRSFCPGSARYQHLPENCFSALSKLSSASVPQMFLCLATDISPEHQRDPVYPRLFTSAMCDTDRGQEHRLSLGGGSWVTSFFISPVQHQLQWQDLLRIKKELTQRRTPAKHKLIKLFSWHSIARE